MDHTESTENVAGPVCPECGGTGLIKCPECDGQVHGSGGGRTSVIDCQACSATGETICPACQGAGRTLESPPR